VRGGPRPFKGCSARVRSRRSHRRNTALTPILDAAQASDSDHRSFERRETALKPRKLLIYAAAGLALSAIAVVGLTVALADSSSSTTTPIKHLVVIFNENATFDHYFGVYPHAANLPGEPPFTPRPGTPAVNGLTETLLKDNPNEDNPERLSRAHVLTCDQDHHYTAEQEAYDNGLVDQFIQHTAGEECTGAEPGPTGENKTTVMDYYDGNTVTALWNYAQYYTLEDNSFETQYGPSTPGHLNFISGETGGASASKPTSAVANGSLIANAYPLYDDCAEGGEDDLAGGVSKEKPRISMSGKNVGNLLNAKEVTWGWFQGGFAATSRNAQGKAECRAAHANVGDAKSYSDYVSYHEPFQYYASTANPHHLPPGSLSAIGHSDQANHQYDLSYFITALDEDNLPAVSFIKPSAYEDGHPGYSDPLDEQRYLVETINAIEQSPEWSSTAIVIEWDDSDGWYDHVMPPIVRPSASSQDSLNGPGKCGVLPSPPPANYQPDRCGYGPRLPMLLISPWAKENYVDSTLTDQSSVLRFIEDNWQLGRIGGDSSDAEAGTLENAFDFNANAPRAPRVILDETTGEVINVTPSDEPPAQSSTTTSSSSTSSSSTSAVSTSTAAATTATSTSSTASYPITGKGPPSLTGGSVASKALTCTLSPRKHHLVVVTCRFKVALIHGRTAVRFRLVRKGRVLATSRAFVHADRATATLRLHSTAKGRYTLRIALTSRAGLLGFIRSVSIR
jgi:phospholipase C